MAFVVTEKVTLSPAIGFDDASGQIHYRYNDGTLTEMYNNIALNIDKDTTPVEIGDTIDFYFSDPLIINTMDYWEDKPAGMLYINYCDMETCNNILEAGKIKKRKKVLCTILK